MGAILGRDSSAAVPAVPETIATQRWELVKRPAGLVSIDDFALRSETLSTSELLEGECLVETEMLSVDAFLRTMLDAEAYHGAIELGATVPALGYGTVVASNNPKLKVGKRVMGMLGACSVAKLSKEAAGMAMPMMSLPCVKPTTFLGLLGLTSASPARLEHHSPPSTRLPPSYFFARTAFLQRVRGHTSCSARARLATLLPYAAPRVTLPFTTGPNSSRRHPFGD